MRIAVTGASGFVGRAVTALMCDEGHQVVSIVRRAGSSDSRSLEFVVANNNFQTLSDDDSGSLTGCEVLVHLAARVHIMRDVDHDPLSAYRTVNVAGTLNVAKAAHRAGVRRIVFVSSVKALGEREAGHPLVESDEPAPTDPYGISKREAEVALLAFGRRTGMSVVVLRPPLVYGPGVKANFEKLLGAVHRNIPLPLDGIRAPRSMVYIGNLADAIKTVAMSERDLPRTLHVADGDDMTARQLVLFAAKFMGKRPRLFYVPAPVLILLGKILGRSEQIERLVTPLRVDSQLLRVELGWMPPFGIESALKETARAYLASH